MSTVQAEVGNYTAQVHDQETLLRDLSKWRATSFVLSSSACLPDKDLSQTPQRTTVRSCFRFKVKITILEFVSLCYSLPVQLERSQSLNFPGDSRVRSPSSRGGRQYFMWRAKSDL